jgi:hypothetical protein
MRTKLATEIINSYSGVYKQVGKITDAMMGVPILFQGKLLDKCAPKTASEWPVGQYSPYRFRQLVSELGIVGRVRSRDQASKKIAADFEYFRDERLPIVDNDECVIHPMFFSRLNTDTKDFHIVYPFPDEPDYLSVL